jgi:ribose transport system ATP-binding protein
VRKQRLLRFVSGDYLPSVVLAALVVLVAVLTSAHNGRFLSSFEVQNTLLLASVLAFVGLGQLVVLMTGNIDLSVGPLMGLIVVVVSYFWAVGQGTGDLLLGIVMVIATAIAVGLVIGLLRQVGRIPSVLASLAVYIVLQGIALQLRPVQAGQLRPDIVAGINTTIGWMPVSFIAAVVVTVVAEMLLRRTHAGLELRAVGSDESRAHRLGARINLTLILAFVLCSLFAAAAGILLAGQIGIGNGDQSVGSPYTLSSITAVVLGGASIFGGRGSFIGALLGALLLTEVVAAVPFLQAALSWNYWIPGIMVLVGAGIFSRARGRRTALLGSTGEA